MRCPATPGSHRGSARGGHDQAFQSPRSGLVVALCGTAADCTARCQPRDLHPNQHAAQGWMLGWELSQPSVYSCAAFLTETTPAQTPITGLKKTSICEAHAHHAELSFAPLLGYPLCLTLEAPTRQRMETGQQGSVDNSRHVTSTTNIMNGLSGSRASCFLCVMYVQDCLRLRPTATA